jgi:hypothetical protein
MRDSGYVALLLIVALIFFIMGVAISDATHTKMRKALHAEKAKIEECEKELPRNVNCVLIAVREEK